MKPRRLSLRRRSQAGVTLVELLVAIIIFGIVSSLLVTAWINLQRTSVFAMQSDNAQGNARDALTRMSTEIRDAQPQTMPTASPSPSPTWDVLTLAQPTEVDFYSAYNQPGANADGSGTAALRLTRLYLDTSGSSPQKNLMWQRDTNNNGTFDGSDRTIVLARNVVNNSIQNTSVTPNTTYTAIFTYGYRAADGSYSTTDNSGSTNLDLTTVISVQIRLITDVNLSHTPKYDDLSTTVRPRISSAI